MANSSARHVLGNAAPIVAMIKWLIVISSMFAFAVLGWNVLNVAFTEDLYCEKGS